MGWAERQIAKLAERAAEPPVPHCRHHLEFRSDCPACVTEREAS